MKKFNKKISLLLLLSIVITLAVPIVGFANETTVELASADSFAVLAGSTITNTGTSIIYGDIGLDPGTSFTGQETLTVTSGAIYIDNAVALQAKNDLQAAYIDAAGRTSNTIGAELGGSTLTPGVYSSATSFGLTGTLTLDGQNNSDAVFILQTGGTLTTATNSKVVLMNGAKAKNIFWQVASSATLGTNSEFKGIILASESITATTGANIQGQLLALNGAVTLDNNTIIALSAGSVSVKKIVDGNIGDMNLPIFELTLTGPDDFSSTRTFVNNESYTWENLEPGEYNVTESRTSLNSDWSVSGEGTVELISEESHFVAITNLYSNPTEGSLTVEKIVSGDIGDMTLPVFELTVTGPEGFSSTRTFVNNESYTWENLVPGEYNVTESRTSLNSDWSVSGEGIVQVVTDETNAVTITNAYDATDNSTSVDREPSNRTTVNRTSVEPLVESLTVEKIAMGDIDGYVLPEFEITVTGPEDFSSTRTLMNNESYTWENLVPGEYNVTENRTGLSSQWAVSGEGTIELVSEESHFVTITNVYTAPTQPINGRLTVQKIVTGEIDGMTLPKFELTITGPEGFSSTRTFVNNESYTWRNLVPGEYSVTENRTNLSSEWTVGGEGTIQLASNEIENTTVTNHYEKIGVLPQTGQKTDYNLAILFGSLAVMMAGVGVLLGKKKNELNE